MFVFKKLVILSCIIPLGILSNLEDNSGTEGQEAEYPEFLNIMQNVEVGGPLTSFLHSFPFPPNQDTPYLEEDPNNESTDDLIHVAEFIMATDHFGTESIFIDIEKDIDNCKDLDNCKNNDINSDNVTQEGSRSSGNKDSVLGKLIRKLKLNAALVTNVTSEESEKIIPDVINYRNDTNESPNADNIPDVMDKSKINESSHVQFPDTPQNEAQDRTDSIPLEEEDIQKASSQNIIDQMVTGPDIVTQMSTSQDIIETTVANEMFTNPDGESPEIKTDLDLSSPDLKVEVDSAPLHDHVRLAIHDEMQDFDKKEVDLEIVKINTHSESQGKDMDIILEKEMKVWPTKDGMSSHSSEDFTLELTKLKMKTSEEVVVEPVKEQSMFESIMTMLF